MTNLEMEQVREQAAMNALGPNVLFQYVDGALRQAADLLWDGYPVEAAELARFAADILQHATNLPKPGAYREPL